MAEGSSRSEVGQAPSASAGKPIPNIREESLTNTSGSTTPNQNDVVQDKSPGIARIEAINRNLTRADRIGLFIGVFLIAYAYGLDGTIRATYQATALADFENHSLISTINVVRTVIAAAAQPTAAKIADVFGRLELVYVSVAFYVVGTIIETFSHSVSTFCAGAVIYQIGLTVVTFLVEVIVADISSLRSRLLWSYIAATPFIINTWVSGDVAQAVLRTTSWRWGVGMWAIIYPVMAIPLIVSLLLAARRARNCGDLEGHKTLRRQIGFKKLIVSLFWQLDLIGVLLIIATFALILVPFTLAGGQTQSWASARILAPLIIGLALIPAFILWERRAPHPLVPFPLLTDRSVWGALGLACMLNFAWYLQGDYLYTILVVAFDASVSAATRIASLYSFVSVLTGVGLSLLVRFRIPYLKPFVVFGTLMFLLAFGLLIHFRNGAVGNAYAGVIAAQCVLGFAGGLFPYPTQVLIQAAAPHEHLALLTGLYLAFYSIGSALGNAVSGAIWTQILPERLRAELGGDGSTAEMAYSDPFGFVAEFPVGTVERAAVVRAYAGAQRVLCITGICLCVGLVGFASVLRNPRLGVEQSLVEADGKVKRDAAGMISGRRNGGREED